MIKNDQELQAHINDWIGLDLREWNHDDIVWAASVDGGMLINYFTDLLQEMKKSRRSYEAEMNAVSNM